MQETTENKSHKHYKNETTIPMGTIHSDGVLKLSTVIFFGKIIVYLLKILYNYIKAALCCHFRNHKEKAGAYVQSFGS